MANVHVVGVEIGLDVGDCLVNNRGRRVNGRDNGTRYYHQDEDSIVTVVQ